MTTVRTKCSSLLILRLRAVATVVLVAAVVSGCSSDNRRSILEQGVQLHRGAGVRRISADEALADVTKSETWWRHQIASRARAYPRQHFENLPAHELRLRLTRLAARYDFRIVSFDLWRPLPDQLAPRVVVATTHYQALAHATPAILKQLDPKRTTADDRTGWRYEGFFFQANDEHAVPFLAAFNFWRGIYSRGGGQWARSDPLFPFAHS
jgi:hypothetical protein